MKSKFGKFAAILITLYQMRLATQLFVNKRKSNKPPKREKHV